MPYGCFSWYAGYDPADFATAYSHVASIFKTTDPNFKIALVGDAGLQAGWPNNGFSQAMPSADLIGMDVYDFSSQSPSQLQASLNFLEANAVANNKGVVVGEWGLATPAVGGNGDDPAFISTMYNWMGSLTPGAGPGQLLVASYFNNGPNALPQFPSSNTLFSQDFGQTGT